ncbi:alpha/beta hydrolase [Bacillus sp. FJAT-49711]|uniref:alpha/beta hydrolase n=1 Tax=Bacillus sp. FJAT-49711 TaxID=2833585 RepID=UPI001BC9ABC8|nr:alpha/beta hydrolase [Bacillus sp. FJAT-49711]MBS4218402.1 alpha/beta hydrolase [Bacillus sp. FJAT-49711]
MLTTYVYKKINDCEVKGDLYAVEDESAPLIVYIHGGGLVWGTKEDILKEQVALYNHAGYHVFSIDYRLAPEAKLPEIIEDIEDALYWVKNQNFFQFDRNRIGVIGGSAGAYLALTTGTFKEKPNVIVSFYGYGNILGDWYLKPSPHYVKTTIVPEILAKQLIKPHQISSAPIEKRYAIYLFCRQQGKWLDYVTDVNLASDKDQLKAFCPIEKVDKTYPPTLLLHGDCDEDVPYDESVQFAETLKKGNVPHNLITIKNGKHVFDQNMSQPQVKEAFTEVLRFIEKYI